MIYIVPTATAADFNLTVAGYVVPTNDAANIDLADSLPAEEPPPDPGGGEAAVANFDLTDDGYRVPLSTAADFDLANPSGVNVPPSIVPGLILRTGAPWRPRPVVKNSSLLGRFQSARRVRTSVGLNSNQASTLVENRTGGPFGRVGERDRRSAKRWGESRPKGARASAAHANTRVVQIGIISYLYQETSKRFFDLLEAPHELAKVADLARTGRFWSSDLWGEGAPFEFDWLKHPRYRSPNAGPIGVGIQIPPPALAGVFDFASPMTIQESRIEPTDRRSIYPHQVAEQNDRLMGIPWGPSGRRDTSISVGYPVEPGDPPGPGDTFEIPIRRIYVVSNSAQIVRVSDGRDIPAQSVDLSTSTDSFLWQMSARLSGRDAMALVEGTDAQPVEVDVIINGTTWRVLVDGWVQQEAAASRGVTIRGRSLSANLAPPYAAVRDYQEGSSLLAQQLAAQELPFGWSITWNALDWSVPAGAWQYQGLSPIQAISRIAEAGGAYVQSDPELQALTVNPRYPAPPWQWNTSTLDFTVPRDVMVQRTSQKKPGQFKNAVFVHGGSVGGIFARVLRDGTAGDQLLPTIVDNLITDVNPARQRGVQAIAGSGRQSLETHEMPVSASLGGVILPGSLIGVGEGVAGSFVQDWIGLVVGTSVTAAAEFGSDRKAKIKVRQRINVERHFES